MFSNVLRNELFVVVFFCVFFFLSNDDNVFDECTGGPVRKKRPVQMSRICAIFILFFCICFDTTNSKESFHL